MIKSIVAVMAGFFFVVVLSIFTDQLLETSGTLKKPFYLNSTGLIAFVVLYRCIFAVAGSWITAQLAPAGPMRHAMIGGVIGFILSIIGAIVMWDTPPHWYPVALIITALPCAWLGAKIFINRKKAI